MRASVDIRADGTLAAPQQNVQRILQRSERRAMTASLRNGLEGTEGDPRRGSHRMILPGHEAGGGWTLRLELDRIGLQLAALIHLGQTRSGVLPHEQHRALG